MTRAEECVRGLSDPIAVEEQIVGERAPSRRERTAQAEWAVKLLMGENAPGRCWTDDPSRIRLQQDDVELAVGSFSRRICGGRVEERLVAVNALAWLRDRRLVSPLIRALADPEWDVRLAAAEGLSELKPLPDWALEPLSRALLDAESVVRVSAARGLAVLPSFEASAALVPALWDPHRTVRLTAASALEELGGASFPHPRAAQALSQLLVEEHDPFVAYAAYWALLWQASPGAHEHCREFRWSTWGQTVWETVSKA